MPKRRQANAPAPKFRVEVERRVDIKVRDQSTPRDVRIAYADAYEEFQSRGCEAGSYRLSGPGDWPRFCVRRLPRNYRLVVIFPEADLVRFILLEPHSDGSDPYAWLEEVFGLAGRANREELPERKPSCCSDRSDPPGGAALAALLDELARQRRTRR